MVVMNRLTVDCDGNPAEPDMHGIGILAWSTAPVAPDQACIDLRKAANHNTANRYPQAGETAGVISLCSLCS